MATVVTVLQILVLLFLQIDQITGKIESIQMAPLQVTKRGYLVVRCTFKQKLTGKDEEFGVKFYHADNADGVPACQFYTDAKGDLEEEHLKPEAKMTNKEKYNPAKACKSSSISTAGNIRTFELYWFNPPPPLNDIWKNGEPFACGITTFESKYSSKKLKVIDFKEDGKVIKACNFTTEYIKTKLKADGTTSVRPAYVEWIWHPFANNHRVSIASPSLTANQRDQACRIRTEQRCKNQKSKIVAVYSYKYLDIDNKEKSVAKSFKSFSEKIKIRSNFIGKLDDKDLLLSLIPELEIADIEKCEEGTYEVKLDIHIATELPKPVAKSAPGGAGGGGGGACAQGSQQFLAGINYCLQYKKPGGDDFQGNLKIAKRTCDGSNALLAAPSNRQQFQAWINAASKFGDDKMVLLGYQYDRSAVINSLGGQFPIDSIQATAQTYYRVHFTRAKRNVAIRTCKNSGGTLATPINNKERDDMSNALKKAKMNSTVWTEFKVNVGTYKFEPTLDNLTPPIYPKTKNFTQPWCLHFKAAQSKLLEEKQCNTKSHFFMCKHSSIVVTATTCIAVLPVTDKNPLRNYILPVECNKDYHFICQKKKGCAAGYTYAGHNNKCYNFHTDKLSHSAAKDMCKQNGDLLAMPKTPWDHDFLSSSANDDMWLGMDKSPTTGDFNFVDGTPVNWNRWIAFEKKTNAFSNDENCTVMSTDYDYYWRTDICNSTFTYACEQNSTLTVSLDPPVTAPIQPHSHLATETEIVIIVAPYGGKLYIGHEYMRTGALIVFCTMQGFNTYSPQPHITISLNGTIGVSESKCEVIVKLVRLEFNIDDVFTCKLQGPAVEYTSGWCAKKNLLPNETYLTNITHRPASKNTHNEEFYVYAVVQIVIAILFMGTIKLGVNQLVMHLDFKRTVSKIRLNTEMKKARYHAYGAHEEKVFEHEDLGQQLLEYISPTLKPKRLIPQFAPTKEEGKEKALRKKAKQAKEVIKDLGLDDKKA